MIIQLPSEYNVYLMVDNVVNMLESHCSSIFLFHGLTITLEVLRVCALLMLCLIEYSQISSLDIIILCMRNNHTKKSRFRFIPCIFIVLITAIALLTVLNVIQQSWIFTLPDFAVPEMQTAVHLQSSHINDKPSLRIFPNRDLFLKNAFHHKNRNRTALDAPVKTIDHQLSKYCPLRKNMCIKDGHWITPNAMDVFNVSLLMFGTGIHSKYKTYRQRMYAEWEEDIISAQKCGMIDESLIILHAWYPHMLWEVLVRIATPLFQYQVFEQFLSKEHRFAIMQLKLYDLSTVHDLLLSPFTNYPFVHLQDLMDNQTASLYPRGINLEIEYFKEHDFQQRKKEYKPQYSQIGDCTCFSQIFWCGFDQQMEKSVKQLPTVFDFLGSHEFGDFAWDMARFYKWYIRETYGPLPLQMIQEKKRPRVIFIQRRTWRRPWIDINQTVHDCQQSQTYFDCKIIFFEDFTHIESIWNMQLCDILVGIHGSGLVNGMFMNELATVLEIIPFRAPDYAPHSGTIMQWIFKRSPQRHAWFPLKSNEQQHQRLRDWQKPFYLSWERLAPILEYLLKTPHDFCDRMIPKHLRMMEFKIGHKTFSKKSPLFSYAPKCNSYEYLTM